MREGGQCAAHPLSFLQGSGWMEVVTMRPPSGCTGTFQPCSFTVKAPIWRGGTSAARGGTHPGERAPFYIWGH